MSVCKHARGKLEVDRRQKNMILLAREHWSVCKVGNVSFIVN